MIHMFLWGMIMEEYKEKPIEGKVAKTYRIGHTTIKIQEESYKDTTKEDIENICKRVKRLYQEHREFENRL